MAKKIRLIDDGTEEVSENQSTNNSGFSSTDVQQLMKYAEAIDWKLWEILKILKSNNPNKEEN